MKRYFYCKDHDRVESVDGECWNSIPPDPTGPRPYEPGWDSTLRCYVSSRRDQVKKADEQGLTPLEDNYKTRDEYKYIRKHKEEWREANWPGYKAGGGGHYAKYLNRVRGTVFSYPGK